MASLGDRILTAATVVVTLGALGTVIWKVVEARSVVIREASSIPVAPRVRDVKDWQEFNHNGQRVGPTNARVTIVEFADYQCPFCARADPELRSIGAAHPTSVAIVYRNFPLDAIHPYARPAAIAAECASYQGKFLPYHSLLFEQQAEFGKVGWSVFAKRVGVYDLARFDACLHSQKPIQALTRDSIATQELGIHSTPSFLINQNLISGYYGPEQLEASVDKALKAATH